MIRKVIEDTTREKYGFFEDGVAKDCTGFTVTIEAFTDEKDTIGSPSLSLTWDNQATGTFWIEGLEGLPRGVYRLKFRFSDSQDHVDYAPDPNVDQTFKLEVLGRAD